MDDIQRLLTASKVYNDTVAKIASLATAGHVRYSSIGTNYDIAPATRSKADIVLTQGPVQFAVHWDELIVSHQGTPTKLYIYLDDLA